MLLRPRCRPLTAQNFWTTAGYFQLLPARIKARNTENVTHCCKPAFHSFGSISPSNYCKAWPFIAYFVIYWGEGGGLGLQRGGSSMKFRCNGGGSKLLNLWKSGEAHAFRYRKRQLCKISNAFSTVQGAQISKFPNASMFTLILSHCVPHSMVHHMHIFHCQFLTNLSQFGQDTLRTSRHVSHIHVSHIWSTPQHFLSELKLTEVRFLTKIPM